MLYWNSFRFTIDDGDGENIRLFLDFPLIDLVLRQIIESPDFAGTLWRFHRRAVPGKALSHQLTFKVYSSKEVAQQIEESVANNCVVSELSSAQIVRGFQWDEKASQVGALKASRKDTSDSKWPESFQLCWPSFAMGFSNSLLDLLEALRNGNDTSFEKLLHYSAPELVSYYKDVNDEIAKLWKSFGADLFLHQTHAIFGYPEFEAVLSNSKGSGAAAIQYIHRKPLAAK